ncbi:MAG: hypothetical protein AAGH78_15285 [Cyanobacteria bacterium P01_H01_bin.58]
MFTPVAPEPTSSDSAQGAQHCVDNLPQSSAVSAWMAGCDGSVPRHILEDSVSCRLVETKPDSSAMSPASRMAIAIRARKERASSRQLSIAGAVSLDVAQPERIGHG